MYQLHNNICSTICAQLADMFSCFQPFISTEVKREVTHCKSHNENRLMRFKHIVILLIICKKNLML